MCVVSGVCLSVFATASVMGQDTLSAYSNVNREVKNQHKQTEQMGVNQSIPWLKDYKFGEYTYS